MLLMETQTITVDAVPAIDTQRTVQLQGLISIEGRRHVVDDFDEEYDRLVEHLHDCSKKAESAETTKRRLPLETLELIRQREAARAARNQELTSELARFSRKAIEKDLKEKRAEVLAEVAETGKSIRYARRNFANR
ncbi:hypothetical protein RB195_023844 [Necator americanus]|uniref:Uncharacterized protein n=1 Tax=Necator americanus TaxID=51031 RepID=A0ABR1EKT0_NECAM